MKRKKNFIEGDLQQKNRLFNEANAAWDRGDLRQAFVLFNQAAELGDSASQLDLGYFYDTGLFVKKDKKKALVFYRKAYAQDDASAANNIATVYRDLGDIGKMLWWFRRATEMGDTGALLELGKRYEEGEMVPKNLEKAKKFYQRVVRSKYVSDDDKIMAMTRLAVLRDRRAVKNELTT